MTGVSEHGPSSRAVKAWAGDYLEIPIQAIDGYQPGDASVADLDGDGELEIVLHQVSRLRDNGSPGVTGEPVLDAYEFDGRHLWRINLGKNIREGEHYTQFMVYDLDGDGRAEVVCKTADGTVDGTGIVIGDAAKPPHPSFFLGDGMNAPPRPDLRLVGEGEALLPQAAR